MYQLIYKGKPYGKPVAWCEMLRMRATVKGVEWAVVA